MNWRAAAFSLVLFLAGCLPDDGASDDLELARRAQLERDWPRAERVLERCLRVERDPEKRWEAWNLLLQAINAANQEPRASLECLDSMLVEFEDDENKVAEILPRMGAYNEALRRWDLAANAWSAYVDLGGLAPLERVEGHRRLARALFSQKRHEAGEDALQQCLALPLADHDKIWCMLDLADAAMGREQWLEVDHLCQQILDSDPGAEVAGLAGYYRGDALEQMGKLQQALEQFEKAREGYPNPAVIENRAAYLKKQLKAK